MGSSHAALRMLPIALWLGALHMHALTANAKRLVGLHEESFDKKLIL